MEDAKRAQCLLLSLGRCFFKDALNKSHTTDPKGSISLLDAHIKVRGNWVEEESLFISPVCSGETSFNKFM